jgi:cation diffusion facilitator family transporter
MSAESHGTKAVVAAFIGNFIIAIAKFVGFGFTGSSSMLAEGIHSVADTGNQGLLLLGGRRARKRATQTHQFGYGRERYFWSFVVALVLFSVGAGFAGYEGVLKILNPHPIESVGWAYGILGFAVVVESYSFRTAIREARPLLRGRSYWQFIRQTKIPELPVVILEDLAALVGLLLALVAISLSEITENPRWDGVGTLSIAFLLGVVAILLAIETQSLLIGESADSREVELLEQALTDDPGVLQIIHLRTQYLGPADLLVAAKLAIEPSYHVAQIADTIDAAEARIREALPNAVYIFIEPDLLRSPSPSEEDQTRT